MQFGSWAFNAPDPPGLLPSMGSIGDCVDNAMSCTGSTTSF
ncbi:hypothetical protein [Streptomyces sp. NPDC018972]